MESLFIEIDHVAIAVHDIEAAIKWYEDVFGATVEHREDVKSDGVYEALVNVAESYIQLLTPTREDSPVAKYLAKNIGRAPWILVACATRPNPQRGAQHGTAAALYGSIFPAVWSFNLALRSRGLGSVITTLHLNQEAKVASLLDIPLEVTQCCLMPIAYTIGTNFRPVARKGIKSVIYWNGWNKNVS